MIENLLIITVLILGFPLGYLLAYLCRDELEEGRKYFKILTLVSSGGGLIFLFFNLEIGFSLVFISIVTSISYIKSGDKKFVKY